MQLLMDCLDVVFFKKKNLYLVKLKIVYKYKQL